MKKLVAKSYNDLDLHKSISNLIKEHSENKEDIREIATRHVDFKAVRDILDLGCGYGWFEETLVNRFRLILGIDYLEENRQAFLATAERISETALFMQAFLPGPIDSEPDSFDLVVCAYSLYFFPGVLSEVKRVLRPGGTFLVITHSVSMLEEGEEFFDFSRLRDIISAFSAENGEELLRRHFDDVGFVDFRNSLVFKRDQKAALGRYIDFKREFISKAADPVAVRDKMLDELGKRGVLRFNKDDRIFVVRK